MNDLTRPFTEEEFNNAFHEAGYPEIARQYCREEFDEYMELATEEISDVEFENEQECLLCLKQSCWTADTVREQAWDWVMQKSKVDIYVQQRQIGHGHEWAKLFCRELTSSNADDSKTYSRVYQELRNQINDEALSYKEFTLAIKNLAKGEDEIVAHYIMSHISEYDGRTDDLLKSALYFKSIYDGLIKDGYDKQEALNHAKNLCDDDEHHQVFYDVYRQAMQYGEKPSDTWALADFCEDMVVNCQLSSASKKFKTKFTKSWQHDIYEKLLMQYDQ